MKAAFQHLYDGCTGVYPLIPAGLEKKKKPTFLARFKPTKHRGYFVARTHVIRSCYEYVHVVSREYLSGPKGHLDNVPGSIRRHPSGGFLVIYNQTAPVAVITADVFIVTWSRDISRQCAIPCGIFRCYEQRTAVMLLELQGSCQGCVKAEPCREHATSEENQSDYSHCVCDVTSTYTCISHQKPGTKYSIPDFQISSIQIQQALQHDTRRAHTL